MLAVSQVELWWFSLSVDEHTLASLIALLSPTEMARANRFRFDHHRRRYQIANGVLRILLANHLHCSPAAIAFTYSERGKPAIADHCQPQGLQFNLSHSEDLGIVGISRDRLIGVDVEYVRDMDNLDSLIKRFFCAEEYRYFQQANSHEQQKIFFQLWTAKEAYLKATGAGLAGVLDQVQLSLSPLKFQSLPGNTEDLKDWGLFSCALLSNYQAAIALGQPWQKTAHLTPWQLEMKAFQFPIS
jgi:4'-phosphopantetheinyl transferase